MSDLIVVNQFTAQYIETTVEWLELSYHIKYVFKCAKIWKSYFIIIITSTSNWYTLESIYPNWLDMKAEKKVPT